MTSDNALEWLARRRPDRNTNLGCGASRLWRRNRRDHQVEVAALLRALFGAPQLQQLVEIIIAQLALDLTLRKRHRDTLPWLHGSAA